MEGFYPKIGEVVCPRTHTHTPHTPHTPIPSAAAHIPLGGLIGGYVLCALPIREHIRICVTFYSGRYSVPLSEEILVPIISGRPCAPSQSPLLRIHLREYGAIVPFLLPHLSTIETICAPKLWEALCSLVEGFVPPNSRRYCVPHVILILDRTPLTP